MNFAKDLMKKYGWEEGKGLGKNEKGIVKPLKANLKFDTSGFGLDKAEEFNNHWWERVFNDAAKNIDIKKDQENVTIETKDNEAVEISTKDYSIKKLRKLKGTQKHDNFLRSSILSGPGNDKELPNKIDTDDVKFTTQYKILTDDELFAACGGRTAHKGARHGIIMKGKLQRIEEQEKELLAKMSAGKNNLDIEMKNVSNVKSNNNDDYDWKLVKNKKNKRKLKSDCDNNDIGIKHHQQDQHETDELNDILYTTEYSNKKSKKKKREEKKNENELVDAMNTVGSITKLSDNVKKNKQNIKIDQEESRKIRMGTQDDAININNYNHHHRTNEVYRKKSKKLKNNGISKCEQYKEKKKLKKSLKKIQNEMEETLAII